MRRFAIGIVLGLLAMAAALPGAAGAQTLFLDYVGFDYESPDPDATQFGEVGSGYVGLGEVPGLFAPVVPDTSLYQYTYHISGLIAVSQASVGPFIVIDYTPGTLSVYEDSKTLGTPADYGINPPNPTAPPSFVDGTLFVTGTLTNFRFIFNTVDQTGSYDSDFEVTGGSEVLNGNIPANQRKGWTFAGATSNALSIPEGYDHQIDGQVFLNEPVPARKTSWGRLKAGYR